MIEIDELIKENQLQYNKINDLKKSISINNLIDELKKLEDLTSSPDFWNNPEESSKVSAKINSLKRTCSLYQDVEKEIIANKDMLDLVINERDEDILKEIIKSNRRINRKLEELEIQTLFTEKYDKIMQLLQFILELEVLKQWIGLKCYIECIQDGLKIMVFS